VSKLKVKAEGKAKPDWIEEGKVEKESGVVSKHDSNNELSLFDNKVLLAVKGLHPSIF
jgi:hypothetical protein